MYENEKARSLLANAAARRFCDGDFKLKYVNKEQRDHAHSHALTLCSSFR